MRWVSRFGSLLLLTGLVGFVGLQWAPALLILFVGAPLVFAGATARALKAQSDPNQG